MTHLRLLVQGLFLLGLIVGLIIVLSDCTTITSTNVVCDALIDSTGVVLEYTTDPPGNEAYCWRVYGDSLAPALGGGG